MRGGTNVDYHNDNQGQKALGRLYIHLIVSPLIVFCYVYVSNPTLNAVSISNGFAVAGLIYLVVALLRLVGRLRFFDFANFGFKKLLEVIRTRNYTRAESQIGTYVDYIGRERKEKPIVGLAVVAVSFLFVSSVLVGK